MGVVVEISDNLYNALFSEKLMREINFRPHGMPQIWRGGVRRAPGKNPGKKRVRGIKGREPLVLAFTVGLRSEILNKKFSVDELRDIVLRRFPIGGTIASHLGWYYAEPEDSVRVLIENTADTKMSDDEFKDAAETMLADFNDELGQSEIWYEFIRNGKREGPAMSMDSRGA